MQIQVGQLVAAAYMALMARSGPAAPPAGRLGALGAALHNLGVGDDHAQCRRGSLRDGSGSTTAGGDRGRRETRAMG